MANVQLIKDKQYLKDVIIRHLKLGKIVEECRETSCNGGSICILLNQHSITGQAIDINNGAIMNS